MKGMAYTVMKGAPSLWATMQLQLSEASPGME
jgi:hypothetical protein